MTAPEYEYSDVEICPGGPMLVRGRQTVTGVDGEQHTTPGPLTAVCRCGKSAQVPWCDGTHKLLPEHRRPD